jgi:hypothetical protein
MPPPRQQEGWHCRPADARAARRSRNRLELSVVAVLRSSGAVVESGSVVAAVNGSRCLRWLTGCGDRCHDRYRFRHRSGTSRRSPPWPVRSLPPVAASSRPELRCPAVRISRSISVAAAPCPLWRAPRKGAQAMANDSTRTVLVALGRACGSRWPRGAMSPASPSRSGQLMRRECVRSCLGTRVTALCRAALIPGL